MDKGWKVFTKGTDRSHSNKPLTLTRAKEQLKALYANADDEEKMSGGMIGGFDDADWRELFGGAEPDDEEEGKPAELPDDTQALLKLDKEVKDFDVEEATGEPEYLKQAKVYAKKAGYKDASSLKLADDGKHKLVLRGVKFGSINNNDYIIYKQYFPAVAEKKRKQYLARACKIKGDWAKDKYSPNSLAINILWDGSSKRGGEDKKLNLKKEGDDPRNWGYDEEVEIPAPEPEEPDLPEQPQFIGDPTQFKPQPYDPNNPLMYMVGGAIPLNKKLYERAKAIVYPKYKKPSAYRSGAVVKMYKDMGGKFKDNEGGRPLARWFKEEWKDVGNKEYPVLRPTKRISKDTPLTAKEIDPENLQLQIKEKQKIKGEQNLKPFVMRGGYTISPELQGAIREALAKITALDASTSPQDHTRRTALEGLERRVIYNRDSLLDFDDASPEYRGHMTLLQNILRDIRSLGMNPSTEQIQKIKSDWDEDNRGPATPRQAPAPRPVGNGLSGGRLAQTDAEETKVAKQIMNKVAGEANAEVKAISETPMGDDNIRKYFPNAKILKYSELADIQDIKQLLPQNKSFFFLLYEQAINTGHWVVVNRYMDNGRDTICFFCSYGSKVDGPLYWNSQGKNRELGQDRPYLTELLQKSGKHLQYNKVQYQSKTSPVATCGAFATLWIKANLRDNMSLQDFHEWIAEIKKETGLSYDAIASNAISKRTF